jgi:hypothetical protein
MVTARERVPIPRMTRAHGEHTRLWIGLSAIIVALVAGGITWMILRPAPTAPALPASVVGFEYFNEATTGIVADPGITSAYVGLNPTFDPDVVPIGLLVEATPVHVADPGITSAYVGLNPTFDPDVVPSGLLDEATSIHAANPGVTTQYLGNSGELFADE